MADSVDPNNRMPRGAIPSPRSALAAARPHIPDLNVTVPSSYLMWPGQMSYWGNNKYGDCVSAEEAFAKITATPYIFIPEATLIGWATQYGYLQGATLVAVLSTMNTKGLAVNGGSVYDGSYNSVDWTNSAILQSAIYSFGPVKIGVAADNLEDNKNGAVTPGKSGWALFGYPQNLPEDHCVSLCGYGNFEDLVGLFKGQGVKVHVPENMPTGLCYAVFTWDSIGIVDEQSMLNMTSEAWVRNPVTTLSSFPTVSQLELKNDGGFVVDIHALYRTPQTPKYAEAENRDNFPIGKTKTMNLQNKCTKPAIQLGDIVQLKVWVEAGADNTYAGLFTYDPNGPTQSFQISGATHNSSIEYIGPQ